MKTFIIEDKTFGTYCRFFYECSEEEFTRYINKKFNKNHTIKGSNGKFVINGREYIYCFIWINRKNNIETLSHEILHLVKYWLLNYFNIALTDETEEVYCLLHSFYLNSILKKLGLNKYVK